MTFDMAPKGLHRFKRKANCLKRPAAQEADDDGVTAKTVKIECPASELQELMVLRLRSVNDPRLCAWDRHDLGDYAQMGLWLLDGMDEGAARAAVKADWGPAAAVVFDRLLRALPAALQARDRHGVIAQLEQLGLRPLAAQNVEHMLCEFRKLMLPGKRPPRGEAFDGCRELWEAVAPVCQRGL